LCRVEGSRFSSGDDSLKGTAKIFGYDVRGSGFKIPSQGCRVQGLEFRVPGSEFSVQGLKFRV
jgi:hypothetical protein